MILIVLQCLRVREQNTIGLQVFVIVFIFVKIQKDW